MKKNDSPGTNKTTVPSSDDGSDSDFATLPQTPPTAAEPSDIVALEEIAADLRPLDEVNDRPNQRGL